jgi:cytochrome c biogenesis protein CcmG, thiol:disulfide interchange protein DsbE
MARARRLVAPLLVLVALTAACGGKGATKVDDQLLATPFELLDGGTDTLGAHAGRPVLVNFFASWCAPCVAEMPDLEQVHQEFRDRVDFLGLDTQEKAEDGRKLVARTGISYPVGLDPDGEMFVAFKGLGMPTTVVLRPDGTIAEVHSGALTAEKFRAMLAKVT